MNYTSFLRKEKAMDWINLAQGKYTWAAATLVDWLSNY
jgi:hypothetical protein